MRDIEELSRPSSPNRSEGVTGDFGEMPPLEDIDPEEYKYDDGTITQARPTVEEEQRPQLPWEGGVFEFRGMRPVVTEQLRSMSDETGHRASMRVTSQAKPRPALQTECITVDVTVGDLRGVALIDTGSSINAISPAFACVAGLEAFPLEKPIGLQLGCVGSRSKINFGMNQEVQIGAESFKTYMDVVNLDHYDLVLGVPFLRDHHVVIHLGKGTMSMGETIVPTRKEVSTKVSNTQRERAKRNPLKTAE